MHAPWEAPTRGDIAFDNTQRKLDDAIEIIQSHSRAFADLIQFEMNKRGIYYNRDHENYALKNNRSNQGELAWIFEQCVIENLDLPDPEDEAERAEQGPEYEKDE